MWTIRHQYEVAFGAFDQNNYNRMLSWLDDQGTPPSDYSPFAEEYNAKLVQYWIKYQNERGYSQPA